MIFFKKIRLYWDTIKYLKPKQIYFRLYYKLRGNKKGSCSVQSKKAIKKKWITSTKSCRDVVCDKSFTAINQTHELNFPHIWNDRNKDMLWLYHLHYLGSYNYELIERWFKDNLPFQGIGWEPYPISLRIVNLIKYALIGLKLPSCWEFSAQAQTEYLYHNLEYHLLGNHLFENAKALIFSGLFFEGKHADKWLQKGLKILSQELEEQFLSNGLHFELSLMYHSILTEGILDLVNLFQCYDKQPSKGWRELISKMMAIQMHYEHPDGTPCHFNDVCEKEYISSKSLLKYANRLSILPDEEKIEELEYYVLENDKMKLICDCGAVGPDYLPGHAHADTLSFELSYLGKRVFVNSGTYLYRNGVMRQKLRSTGAHNSISINGLSSSQMWSSFRVAKRARVKNLIVKDNTIHASHDGFEQQLKKTASHSRQWTLNQDGLIIHDIINGQSLALESFLHLHPDFSVNPIDDHQFELTDGDKFLKLIVNAEQSFVKIEDCYFYPEFGKKEPTKKICVITNVSDNKAEISCLIALKE